MGLTQVQLNEFYETGILIIRNFFTKQEVAEASEIADRLYAEAERLAQQEVGKVMYKGTQFVSEAVDGETEILRVVWGGAAEPQLLKLGQLSKLLIPVSQILESDTANQLNNQLHYKFPNGGANLTFYQDISNRKNFDSDWKDINGKGSFLLTLVALDPMDATTATISYVPMSHLRGDLNLDKITDKAELAKVAELDKAVPLQLDAGDLILWHPYLIHGADPNKFATQQRLFINGFAYPGANNKPYPGEGSAQLVSLKLNP